MRKVVYLLASAALTFGSFSVIGSTPVQAADAVSVSGKALFTADGKRLGAIYRTTADGSAQVIVNGKIVTIPAATLSNTDGKIQTSLNKSDLKKR